MHLYTRIHFYAGGLGFTVACHGVFRQGAAGVDSVNNMPRGGLGLMAPGVERLPAFDGHRFEQRLHQKI